MPQNSARYQDSPQTVDHTDAPSADSAGSSAPTTPVVVDAKASGPPSVTSSNPAAAAGGAGGLPAADDDLISLVSEGELADAAGHVAIEAAWVATLPPLLSQFADALIVPLLVREDCTDEATSKTVMSVAPFVALFPFVRAVAVASMLNSANTEHLAVVFGDLLAVGALVGGYGALRATQAAGFIPEIVAAALGIAAILCAIGSVDNPSHAFSLAVWMFVWLVRHRAALVTLPLFVTAIGLSIGSTHKVQEDANDWPVLTLESDGVSARQAWSVLPLWMVLWGMLGSWLAGHRISHTVATLQGTVQAAVIVTQQLRLFETDDARRVLVQDPHNASTAMHAETTNSAEGNNSSSFSPASSGGIAGIADDGLRRALDGLITSMESYKPHIPNWLITEAAELAAEDAERARRQSSFVAPPLMIDGNDEADEDDPDLEGSISMRTDSSIAGANSSISNDSLSSGGFPPRSPVGLPQMSPKTAMSINMQQQQQGRVDRGPHVSLGVARETNVVLGIVRYSMDALNSAAQTSSDAIEAVNKFVDRVHLSASATHGSLHGFIGDTIAVTWNTASRLAQPELKAASFLIRLRSLTVDSGGTTPGSYISALRVAGAAYVGRARVQLAGTSRNQGLVVSMDWRDTVEALAAHAEQIGTFVVPGLMRQHIAHGVTLRGIATTHAKGCKPKGWWVKSTTPSAQFNRNLASVRSGAFASSTGPVTPLQSRTHKPRVAGHPNAFPGAAGFDENELVPTVPDNNADAASKNAATPRTSGGRRRVGLYELLSEVDITANGEWMYVLEKHRLGQGGMAGAASGSVTAPVGHVISPTLPAVVTPRSSDSDNTNSALPPPATTPGDSTAVTPRDADDDSALNALATRYVELWEAESPGAAQAATQLTKAAARHAAILSTPANAPLRALIASLDGTAGGGPLSGASSSLTGLPSPALNNARRGSNSPAMSPIAVLDDGI